MKHVLFKCGICGEVSTAGEWNGATVILAKNRKERRSFVRIQDAGRQSRWYCCPKCGKNSTLEKIQPMKDSEVA